MSRSARQPLFAALLLMVAAAGLLWLMGRPPICTCGRIDWWGNVGPEQSQMLADWYSFSHVIHGILFYAVFALVLKKVPVERRFLYATGFSGHGFQQAPAVGEHLAELIVGEEPSLDLSPLSLDRFARGGERRERFVV